MRQFAPVSGLGSTIGQSATATFCLGLPNALAWELTTCRNAFEELGIKAYSQIQYGGNPSPAPAPGPGAPGSTAQENMQAYIKAQQARIAQLEAEGYHPDPTMPSLTAEEWAAGIEQAKKDLNKALEDVFDVTPYLIGAAIIFAAVVFTQR